MTEPATSSSLYEQACRLMPGGVSSPVRAFKGVGGTPRFIAAARGACLYDVDGRPLIDYVGSWGAAILGHAHPRVVESVTRAAAAGASYGLCSPLEIELAAEVCARVPSVQRVRFVSSGTEAVMSAIRLARAATGREKIVKFDGGYHGHADALLVQAGSGVATLGLPDSPGVARGATADTLTAPYNDADAVERLLQAHPGEVAAILVEPVAGNMGVVLPLPGWLNRLGALCLRHGALLILDEVMTGFRVARGGAQELYGVQPDLTTLGKILGGGLPVAAYGGRADLMARVAPAGPVYQAGTLSGNPLGMAAGLCTLRELTAEAYAALEAAASGLAAGLTEQLDRHGVRGCVQRAGSMLTLFFGVPAVRNYEEARRADHAAFARFFHAMLERGVHLPPSGYEAWFVSLAHEHAVIKRTLEAAGESLAQMARPV